MKEDFYEEYAHYQSDHWWFLGRKKIILSLLSRFLGEGTNSRSILDIGCGTGVMLDSLQHYGKAMGIDMSDRALFFSNKITSAPLIQAEFTSLPFKGQSFDLVCAFDVLEHLDHDSDCVREAYRLCRPGGSVLVTVPAFQFLWGIQDVVSHHKRRYSQKEIINLLKRNGFYPVFSSYFNTFLFPVIAFVRLFSRLKKTQNRHSDLDIQTPQLLNRMLTRLFGFERFLLKYFRFPFGVSLICLAQKPAYTQPL